MIPLHERLQDCIGRVVEIEIVDHAMNDRTLCRVVVTGELAEATAEHLVIRTWHTVNAESNDEFICLITSAVKVVRLMKIDFVEFGYEPNK